MNQQTNERPNDESRLQICIKMMFFIYICSHLLTSSYLIAVCWSFNIICIIGNWMAPPIGSDMLRSQVYMPLLNVYMHLCNDAGWRRWWW